MKLQNNSDRTRAGGLALIELLVVIANHRHAARLVACRNAAAQGEGVAHRMFEQHHATGAWCPTMYAEDKDNQNRYPTMKWRPGESAILF